MLDVATLAVNVDTTDLKDGRADMEMFTASGARAENQVNRLAGSTRNAGGAISRFAGGSGLRMASMQLSQVAQQGAATGNYMQALAIQAPDLALGFGAIGIAVGALVPVLYGLGSAYLDSGDGAQNLDDALEDLKETAEGMLVPLDILKMDVDDLTEKYGSATERVLGFARAQAELRAAQAEGRLREQVGLLDDVVAGYLSSTKEGGRYEAVLARIGEEFDVQRAAAEELSFAFEGLYRSGDFESQQAALSDILDVLEENNIEISKIPEGLQLAISDMITLSNETDRARAIMEQLSAAAANVTVGVPLYDQNLSADELLPPAPQPSVAPRGRRSGGGGGGPRVDPAEREAQRIFEQTRTAAERYATELAKIDELLEDGHLTQDTYNRAIAQAEERYQSAKGAASEWASVNDLLKDSFLQFAMEGGDAMDSIAAAIRRAALEALLFGEGPLGNLFSSLGGGGIFGAIDKLLSFDGGGFTGGGPRSGGVDGKGGFMAVLHPNETVIDHTKGQSSGGGGTAPIVYSPTINMPGADAAAVARLEAILVKDRAEFEGRVVKTILTAQKRRVL